jgi:hypothetical protein
MPSSSRVEMPSAVATRQREKPRRPARITMSATSSDGESPASRASLPGPLISRRSTPSVPTPKRQSHLFASTPVVAGLESPPLRPLRKYRTLLPPPPPPCSGTIELPQPAECDSRFGSVQRSGSSQSVAPLRSHAHWEASLSETSDACHYRYLAGLRRRRHRSSESLGRGCRRPARCGQGWAHSCGDRRNPWPGPHQSEVLGASMASRVSRR